jgi:hypothetical protein
MGPHLLENPPYRVITGTSEAPSRKNYVEVNPTSYAQRTGVNFRKHLESLCLIPSGKTRPCFNS